MNMKSLLLVFLLSGQALAASNPTRIAGSDGTNTRTFRTDTSGRMQISTDQSIFGELITNDRISQFIAQFDLSLSSNDVTASTANGGSASQGSGVLTVSTSTNANGTASVASNKSLAYSPARELYAFFTLVMTTGPTTSGEVFRIGLIGANDGVYLCWNGSTGIGVCTMKGGSETQVLRASWNGDPLDGRSGSQFTSGGSPVAWDITKEYPYRIRLGWLGAAIIKFEVSSPDGEWITMHTIRYPGSAAVPSLNTPGIPFKISMTKSSGSSTDLSAGTSSWDIGTVESPAGLAPEDVKGRKYTTGQSGAFAASTTIYTVTTGRTLRITGGNVMCYNTNLSTAGLLNIRDGDGGTILFPVSMASTTNQSASQVVVPYTFPTGLKFTSAVYAQVASGTLSCSFMFTGYEAEQ